jgi:hypothetical protein
MEHKTVTIKGDIIREGSSTGKVITLEELGKRYRSVRAELLETSRALDWNREQLTRARAVLDYLDTKTMIKIKE